MGSEPILVLKRENRLLTKWSEWKYNYNYEHIAEFLELIGSDSYRKLKIANSQYDSQDLKIHLTDFLEYFRLSLNKVWGTCCAGIWILSTRYPLPGYTRILTEKLHWFRKSAVWSNKTWSIGLRQKSLMHIYSIVNLDLLLIKEKVSHLWMVFVIKYYSDYKKKKLKYSN